MELQATGDRHIAHQPYRVLTGWWCLRQETARPMLLCRGLQGC